MKKFITHHGLAVGIARQNIDTDQIIPKQFLKKIDKTGFGKHLFFDWRFLENGEANLEFVLNKPDFKGASILVAGDNFGCGSSREHAPWALLDYGFQVIVSSSFADIFFNNCFKNGILPVVVSPENLQKIFYELENTKGVTFDIDLEKQILKAKFLGEIKFNITSRQKEFLIKGLDDISWTLQFESDIRNFEEKQKFELPWLWQASSFK